MLKIYVVNLDRNSERLERMRSQFMQMRVPFERFAAIDGRNLNPVAVERFKATRPLKNSGDSHSPCGRTWSPSSIGCFLSHYALWKIAAESDQPYTVIFEDDVHMSLDIRQFLEDDRWIPGDADIIRFEPSYNRVRLVGAKKPIFGRTLQTIHSSNLEHCWPVCTGGYITSREAARHLLSVPEEQHTMADIFLFSRLESPIASKLRIYQLSPALCIQDKFQHPDPSDIVFKSEIELEPHSSVSNAIERLWRTARAVFLITLGYRRVIYSATGRSKSTL